MIVGLEHIAIAVTELDEAIKRFSTDLGLSTPNTQDVDDQSTRVAIIPVGGEKTVVGTKIELISAINDDGPVAKFMDRRGSGGLHHLCFVSDNLDHDVMRLRDKGYQFLTDQPTIGADNRRVIFIHPRSFDGVLVEIAES